MKLTGLLAFFLLASCASPGGLKADLSKIRPWSPELSRREPLPAPYVVDHVAGAKALTYVAVDHSNEANSASIKLVGGVMEARRFSVVLLEGFPRSLGVNPAGFRERAEKDGANGFFREGETSVAVLKAARKSVPFIGGEPDEELVKSNVIAAGFSVEDLFCFYITRQVPQWRRDGTLTRGGFEEAYLEYAPKVGKHLGFAAGQEPSLEAYHKWYQAKMGRPFRARDVSTETVAPYAGGELYTQRIASITSRVRNEHIVRVTEELLNRYGRVLMVFGSSHYPVQQLALESMLGKPARISDQP
jgi:hypothetical protein